VNSEASTESVSIDTLTKLEQPEKARVPILVTLSPINTDAKLEQL
jgi:hypothetical protein